MDRQKEHKTARVFARLEPSLDGELDAVAAAEKREKSEVVRVAIRQYVDRHKAAKVLDPVREQLMAGATR